MRYLTLAVLGMLVLLAGVTASNPAYAHRGDGLGREVLHVCIDDGEMEVVGSRGSCDGGRRLHIPLYTDGGPLVVPTEILVGSGTTRYADGFVQSISTDEYAIKNSLRLLPPNPIEPALELSYPPDPIERTFSFFPPDPVAAVTPARIVSSTGEVEIVASPELLPPNPIEPALELSYPPNPIESSLSFYPPDPVEPDAPARIVSSTGEVAIEDKLTVEETLTVGNSITIDGTVATGDRIFASTGTLSFEDNTLVTTGKVAIGTTDFGPTSPIPQLLTEADAGGLGLRVKGSAGYEPAISLDSGSQEWRIVNWDNDTLRFVDISGATRTMVTIYPDEDAEETALVLRDYRVGIGTASPSEKPDVVGNAEISGTLTVPICDGCAAPSDARLKRDIEPLTNVLEKLEQVHGVSYQRIDREGSDRHIGVIAQELEAVFPELVSTSGDEGYKAVSYGNLTAVLVEAVKELKAENDDLRARLEALEQAAEIDTGSAAPVTSGRFSPWFLLGGLAMAGLVLGGFVTVKRTRRGDED